MEAAGGAKGVQGGRGDLASRRQAGTWFHRPAEAWGWPLGCLLRVEKSHWRFLSREVTQWIFVLKKVTVVVEGMEDIRGEHRDHTACNPSGQGEQSRWFEWGWKQRRQKEQYRF